MLSRLCRPSFAAFGSLSSGQSQLPLPLNNAIVRCMASSSKPNQAQSGYEEGPERDLINFPRPKRLEHPPPVRFGFVPEDWFTFFYSKTGVTGPYAFGTGVLTYVLSKEIWVLEHEFWGGVSLAIMIVYAVKKLGPSVAIWADKEVDTHIDELNAGKKSEIAALNKAIEAEKVAQYQAEGMKILFDVKRENVALQLEDAYRQRLMKVYGDVKKRLDYQVEVQQVERNIQQKHMATWIIESVRKAITNESEAENLKKCIADLKLLSVK